MTNPYFSLLKKVKEAVLKEDTIPLFKVMAPFDWEKLCDNIKKNYDLTNFTLSPRSTRWLTLEELKGGLGENINTVSLTLSPLFGTAYLLMGERDISKLTSLILTKSSRKVFTTAILEESFYRYFILSTLSHLEEMKNFKGLSFKMTEEQPKGNTFLCLDVEIGLDDVSCTSRVVIDPDFRRAWNEHFSLFPSAFEREIKKTTEVILKVEVAKTVISSDDLKKIEKGDFIALDTGGIDLKAKKGLATIKLEDVSLFQAKIKQNKITLLDFEKEEKIMEEEIKEEAIPLEKVEEKVSSIEKTPITLTVEVARVKITLEKLLQLHPANILELPASIDQPVDISVNGQKIGKAELITLGEKLGIRVLEIGKLK